MPRQTPERPLKGWTTKERDGGKVENGVTDQCLCLSRIIESEPGETSGTCALE